MGRTPPRRQSPGGWRALRAPLVPGACLTALILALLAAPSAQAASPQIAAAWTSEVGSTSATFRGEVNPEGSSTSCRFEYTTEAHFSAQGFAGASAITCEKDPGSGTSPVAVARHVSGLKTATAYRYRLLASNLSGTTTLETNPSGASLSFTTQPIGASFALPDSRAWELVSPPEKNGGAIQGPEQNHGGGVFQAAAGGEGAITYTSASSFGGYEAEGAPQASQYISRRSVSGWSTQNITAPVVSGSYGNDPNGVPYQLFSAGLERALILNGRHCRGEGSGCPVANPPLPGSGAPEGFQDYYLRDNQANGYAALLSEANRGPLSLSSSQFNLALAGASPDLSHVVLSTCAALTADAIEAAGPQGCEPDATNLYEWSDGQLALINLIAGDAHGTPFASLAAPAGAVSGNGTRVYWTLPGGPLYLYDGAASHLLPETTGAEVSFQVASPDGAVAYFAREGHLFRYFATTEVSTEIAVTGSLKGVLGVSADGSVVYFQTSAGLYRWAAPGTLTPLAAGAQAAQPGDYPPATGTARVSADGNELLFLSAESLTAYDNHDAASGQPDSEVFRYAAGSGGGGSLSCLSCNPTGERPAGSSTIPGAYANGSEAHLAPGQLLTDSYKPRSLSADGHRAFFDSADALAPLDTNRASDAYQWEAGGEGSCAAAAGCLSLISSGTDPQGASFLDASESGADAYFLTTASLSEPQNLPHTTITPQGNVDPGSADVYDARVGGGYPEPQPQIPCEADECAPLPPEPEDPTVGTIVPGSPNPPPHFPTVPCKKGAVRKGGKCVKKPHHKKPHPKRAPR